MNAPKTVNIRYPIHDVLAQRWSPRAFAARDVSDADLRGIFEAARWAASAFNEQPWRFVVARKSQHPEAHAKIAARLAAGNRVWAENAPVLIATTAAPAFKLNGNANRWAAYDAGQSVAMLSVEATKRGLVLHQMGGFDQSGLATDLELPDGWEILSVTALGHPGNPENLAPEYVDKERAARGRIGQDAFVFGAAFDAPLKTSADTHRVIDFWFGNLDRHGLADKEHVSSWWKKDEAFDAALRAHFMDLHAEIMDGGRRTWQSQDLGVLATVIVLDQFSRNMFRGTPRMYESDQLAVELATKALEDGVDRRVATHHAVFLYMPFMHSEALEHQERCITLFRELAERVEGPARDAVSGNVDYAIQHRDIVARFGRFPHRNEILGRDSSAEEREFLTQPGSSF